MIKKFLKIDDFILAIFTVIVLFWGLLFLDNFDIHLLFIRQLVGFIFLTVLPGILILKILNITKLSTIEKILIGLGISISTILLLGFFLSIISPLIGLDHPISLFPFSILLTIFLTLLTIVYYYKLLKNQPNYDTFFPSIRDLFLDIRLLNRPFTWLLCLLPFVSIFGTYLVNNYELNFVLMFLLILISVVVFIIAIKKEIPIPLYSLAIFLISLSLLFHRSLISYYLTGFDIQSEYQIANYVLQNSVWNISLPYTLNGMLSIVILAPVYSNILDLNLIWVFKIIYPLLFSFVPVTIFKIIQSQTNEKFSFFSTFLFVSYYTFYTEMLGLARQQIAEIFLVLLLFLIISVVNSPQKTLLLIFFGFGIITAHYGVSYLFLFFITFLLILNYMLNHTSIQKIIPYFKNFLLDFQKNINSIQSSFNESSISPFFVFFFIVLIFSWYVFIASATNFGSVGSVGSKLLDIVSTDLGNSEKVEAIATLQIDATTLLRSFNKYFMISVQLFLILGFFLIVFTRKFHFTKQYILFLIPSFGFLMASTIIPYFAAMNIARTYQILLIILAPCIILGLYSFFDNLLSSIKIMKRKSIAVCVLIASFCAIYFLLQTQFIFTLANDNPGSISLNVDNDYIKFNSEEYIGAQWLEQYSQGYAIIADDYRRMIFVGITDSASKDSFDFRSKLGAYYFLGTKNVLENKWLSSKLVGENQVIRGYYELPEELQKSSKIYDNKKSATYIQI